MASEEEQQFCQRSLVSQLTTKVFGSTMNNSTNSGTSVEANATAGAAAATTSTAAVPEFVHLTETRRYIYRVIAAIHDESFPKHVHQLLKLFERAIREEFVSAQNSSLNCRKLARQVIALTELVHEQLQLGKQWMELRSSLENRQRICYIIANYIACELCAAQDKMEKEQCIIERINSMLTLFIEQNNANSSALKEDMLCTLVAVPKLFMQDTIVTALYSRLFPQWPKIIDVCYQVELPDKLYIEYIIVFYYWHRLVRDEDTRQRIYEFAAKFMRPSRTLFSNPTYLNHMPMISDISTATLSILQFLKMKGCFKLHATSKLDNRQSTANDLLLDSDEEDVELDTAGEILMGNKTTGESAQEQEQPDFLRRLCRNATHQKPVERATALYRGIDSSREVVDLCESDEDVDMFSLDFNVPATVDTNVSADDDYVPITMIYPSNLRTYERTTSSFTATTETVVTSDSQLEIFTANASVTAEPHYTVPRIVNSYSCCREVMNQSVQTAEMSFVATHLEPTYRELHLQQASSQNSRSSGTTTLPPKKQVTFKAQLLGPGHKSTKDSRSSKAIKPSIKQYKVQHADNSIESLKLMARQEHLLASKRMFTKLETKRNCDKSFVGTLTRQTLRPQCPAIAVVSSTQLTPTTSNASTDTPTPQHHHQRLATQRAMPTPPASTHSSSDTPRNTPDSRLRSHARRSYFKSNGRRLNKTSQDEVNFYNELLRQQRAKVNERRHGKPVTTPVVRLKRINLNETEIANYNAVFNATSNARR
ncbi:CG12316 [Drosophila busckii]|uniref:CG12316 n=1 Tax=Drosophila busckii TaxID=30019 RepID=A0A0M5JBH4_DROBS|nr:CG12316 [Drosophila busckii]